MRTAHLALFCKGFQIDDNGVLNIIAVFDSVFIGDTKDFVLHDTVLLARFIGDAVDRNDLRPRTGSLVIKQFALKSDGIKSLVRTDEAVQINLTPRDHPGHLGHQVNLLLDEIKLPEAGEYIFEVILDGSILAEIPLFALAEIPNPV